MKKIIFILSLVFYAQPILAKVLFDAPATCAVDTSGQNTFYICSGNINKGGSCAGKTFRPGWGHSRVWAKDGDTFNFNDETYICKGGKFQSLGVSGVLFNNPATCAVNYVKAKDVFYVCSETVDKDNPCAGLNYNPDKGDSIIQMTADSMENIGGDIYTCKDGILQKSVSGTSGYIWGENNWCAVQDKSVNKNFYLCGDDGSGKDLKCNRRNYSSLFSDNRKFYKNNEEVTIGDKSYTCCIETGENTGSFKDTTELVDVTTTVKIGNGTCTYTQKQNVCGDIVDKGKACQCNEGYKLVNDECILKSAPAGAANNCPITDNQGIDKNGICQKCTGETPKWDKTLLKCVADSSTDTQQSDSTSSGTLSGNTQLSSPVASSSSTQQSSSEPSEPSEPELIEITKEDMEKCWFCRKKEAFIGCVKSKGNPTNSAYKKDCNLD